MLQARFALSVALLPVLAACASSPVGEYPSLAIRDAERWTGSLEVEPYVPPAPPAASVASAGELAAQARAAHQRFLAALPAARNRVAAARGGSVGSENWSRAQVAIADLESHRGQTMIALADLDRIYVATSTDGQAIAPVQYERGEVEALVAEETAIIDGLLGQLR